MLWRKLKVQLWKLTGCIARSCKGLKCGFQTAFNYQMEEMVVTMSSLKLSPDYKFINLSNYRVIKLSNYQIIKLLNVQSSFNYQKMREIAVMRSSLQFSLIKIGFNWICNQTIRIYPSKFSFVQIILMQLHLNVMKINLIEICFDWICNQTTLMFSFVQII